MITRRLMAVQVCYCQDMQVVAHKCFDTVAAANEWIRRQYGRLFNVHTLDGYRDGSYLILVKLY